MTHENCLAELQQQGAARPTPSAAAAPAKTAVSVISSLLLKRIPPKSEGPRAVHARLRQRARSSPAQAALAGGGAPRENRRLASFGAPAAEPRHLMAAAPPQVAFSNYPRVPPH